MQQCESLARHGVAVITACYYCRFNCIVVNDCGEYPLTYYVICETFQNKRSQLNSFVSFLAQWDGQWNPCSECGLYSKWNSTKVNINIEWKNAIAFHMHAIKHSIFAFGSSSFFFSCRYKKIKCFQWLPKKRTEKTPSVMFGTYSIYMAVMFDPPLCFALYAIAMRN